jgi:ankyrin repeat protein
MQVIVSQSKSRHELERDFLKAATNGYKNKVKELLEMVNVNIHILYGETALIRASSRGRTEIVKLLLKAGANPDTKDNYGETALMRASLSGHKDIVILLLKAGANPDTKDNYGETALMKASYNGHKEIVKLLLKAGADVNLQATRGDTALMNASKRPRRPTHPCVVRTHARERRDGGMRGKRREGHKDIVELLLKAGANVDIQNNKGYTALMWASLSGRKDIEIFKPLLEAGADVNLGDKLGETALTIARRRGHTAIVELLEEN